MHFGCVLVRISIVLAEIFCQNNVCLLGVPIRSYTNWSVQSQKVVIDLGSRWAEKTNAH